MTSPYLVPVCALLSERLDVRKPGPDDDLIESGTLDSLSLIELLFQLEEEFGIALELEEIDPELFRTPAAIARLVESKVGR